MGVRSSWDASDTKRSWEEYDSLMRSSMALMASARVFSSRWVEGTDVKKFEEFKRKNEVNLALDGGDNLTYIAPTMVNLRLAQERHADVQFRQTREH